MQTLEGKSTAPAAWVLVTQWETWPVLFASGSGLGSDLAAVGILGEFAFCLCFLTLSAFQMNL